MKPLEHPDSLHLQAAEGWLELGDAAEADKELDEITRQRRAHPDVLQMRWRVLAAAKEWEACVEIATAITKVAPKRAFGWLQRSFALHELKCTQQARDNLLAVLERFPKNATIPYNIACYECQLGRLQEAKDWLVKEFAIGDEINIKVMALGDADLMPIWKDIGNLNP